MAVEKNNRHADFIKKVAAQLKDENLKLLRGDVFKYLQSVPPGSFDLIFADPPYALLELAKIPEIILERGLLKEGGILIMEHPREYDFSALPYFSQHRVYGSVNFILFIKEEERTDA